MCHSGSDTSKRQILAGNFVAWWTVSTVLLSLYGAVLATERKELSRAKSVNETSPTRRSNFINSLVLRRRYVLMQAC